jgi:hypothetical protein
MSGGGLHGLHSWETTGRVILDCSEDSIGSPQAINYLLHQATNTLIEQNALSRVSRRNRKRAHRQPQTGSTLHHITVVPRWGGMLSLCHLFVKLPTLDAIPRVLRSRCQGHTHARIPWTLQNPRSTTSSSDCIPSSAICMKPPPTYATAVQAHMLWTVFARVTNSAGWDFRITVTESRWGHGIVWPSSRSSSSGNIAGSIYTKWGRWGPLLGSHNTLVVAVDTGVSIIAALSCASRSNASCVTNA